ncbi:MAG: 2-C-methyl-D-erythritol 4-phosphate cytidylyltransferase, partial [Alphaproteobacteria bacterium]|nr:2-C-methyl-D-erythritol 4-phosphate cytidylyltransferase [Alphaproteobacteria bacterium]
MTSSSTPDCSVIIVAAGRGYRAGGDIPKQYRLVGGKPLIRYSAEKFAAHPNTRKLVVVVHPNDVEFYSEALAGIECDFVFGGEERQDSVRKGLSHLSNCVEDDSIVLIHDAARPFITADLIDSTIEAAANYGAAVPCIDIVDTIKTVKSTGSDGSIIYKVSGDIDRNKVRAIQTPQAFRFAIVLECHLAAKGQKLTDDSSVLAFFDNDVVLIDGSPENIKITTQEDFRKADEMLEKSSKHMPRMATGFDVHAFEEGDHVTLCGVDIAHSKKLKGHSDADVAMHALTDALLGCICAGDIGSHFPPTDPKWKGVRSEVFLSHAAELIK